MLTLNVPAEVRKGRGPNHQRSLYNGKAKQPLGLPSRAPACFESQSQWNNYRELAEYSAGTGWTYCTDCTPEHKAKMVAEGRCKFPRTGFVTNRGVVTGRRVVETKVVRFVAFKRAVKP
jgi:hypothetical protein